MASNVSVAIEVLKGRLLASDRVEEMIKEVGKESSEKYCWIAYRIRPDEHSGRKEGGQSRGVEAKDTCPNMHDEINRQD